MNRLAALVLVAPLTAFAQDTAPSFFARLSSPLLDLLLSALVAGIGALILYLRSKGAESRAARVGLVVSEAAKAAVLELDATLRPQLEKALADGVLTDAEKAQLKAAAVDLLKTKLPAGLLTLAGGVFGAFTDTYLAGKVEEAVATKNAVQAAGETAPASPPLA